MEPDLKQTSLACQLAGFLWSHQLPIGLSFTLPPLALLCFVISNVAGASAYWWRFYVVMPQWHLLTPALFAVCMLGTAILCIYCLRGIRPNQADNKEHTAVLLAALGFTYQVIGAWPMWSRAYPWSWQIEIAGYGVWLVLPLFAVSLLALLAGGTSLYLHSRLYHEKYALE
jgi:uncharacterized membrane protein